METVAVQTKLEHWQEVKSHPLHVPAYEEVCQVLTNCLQANFKDVAVSVAACPDLTQAPFHLASPGITGKPKLVDVGGVPNLIPLVTRSKIYNLRDVADQIGMPDCFFIGAGAGSSRLAGTNCELMPNVHIGKQKIESRFAKVNPLDGSCEVIHYDSTEFGLLGNFLATEGVSGQVIKVEVSHRTGDKNFVTCMREGLGAHYDDKPVGIGGVFLIEKGSAKYHVMPDFSKIPLESDAAVDGWLKFYHTSAPFTCLSTFISHDPGLDLRVDHTHGFNLKGDGGHYHYDVTPTDVKYTGYFVVAEQIFRIDPPTKTHQIGRD
eukprot:m.121065 g.121065  ORF g.121065 m.121065 type:complete len:320 (+) comp13700_c0_seq5:203-1162(+)